MKYRVLDERLAVCRAGTDAEFVRFAAGGGFLCMTRTPDELSFVCEERLIRADHEKLAVECGWIALKLEGPFPFSTTGVLASFLAPLAKAGIPIFAISTFDTDYVLLKQEEIERAKKALARAGHEETR